MNQLKTGRTCVGYTMVLLALLLMARAAMAYTPTQDPHAVQISPGVLVMGEYDWALSGTDTKPISRCLDMVARARQFSTSNRLNFVVVHHWLPNSDGFGVSSYCYMHTGGAAPGAGVQGTCLNWTSAKVAEFKLSMTYCFAEALKQGFTPNIRPYLDDGAQRGIWRNGLLFSPTTKYGRYSYTDLMIQPLAEAMRDALAAAAQVGKLMTPPDRNRPVVYMSVTGEMSATVMRFTAEWSGLFAIIKNIIGSTLADVKVGVGLNFNALDAVESQPITDAAATTPTFSLFNFLSGSYAAPSVRYPASVPSINGAGVKELLTNRADFLGISAYYPFTSASFGLAEFQNSAVTIADSLAKLAAGVNLANLASSGKLELQYGEFGIGCGVDGKSQLSASADACAKAPWAGIIGSYSSALDPWRRSDLSASRTSFYSKALDWLSSADSYPYKISGVFIWSMSSWDVLGIYPESTGYRDIGVAQKVAAYDMAVLAAQVCGNGDNQACDKFVKANAACLNNESGAACLNRPAVSNPTVITEAGPAQSGTSPSPPSSPSPESQDHSNGTASANTTAGVTLDAAAAAFNATVGDFAGDSTPVLYLWAYCQPSHLRYNQEQCR